MGRYFFDREKEIVLSYSNKYGELFNDVKLNRGNSVILYNTIFFIKRLIFSILIV